MRYDTKVEIYNIAKIDDGMGGYEEVLSLVDTVLAHKATLSFTISEKLFGKVSVTALNCMINKKMSFDNNADTLVLIDNRKYDIVTYKNYRNKTHLYLEVMDNGNS